MAPAAERVFVDSNVLLYALDSANPRKRASAAAWLDLLWREGTGELSWQVLNEFYFNAVRKLNVPAPLARERVRLFAVWRPREISLETVERAWRWMDQAKLSYWDALIVATAEGCGASVLLTEDLQDGQRLGNCRVRSPFTALPGASLSP